MNGQRRAEQTWCLAYGALLGAVLGFAVATKITGAGDLRIAILLAVVGAGAGCFYCLPTIIAIGNDHPYIAGILVINLLLGWTFLGWVACLAWAVSPPPRR